MANNISGPRPGKETGAEAGDQDHEDILQYAEQLPGYGDRDSGSLTAGKKTARSFLGEERRMMLSVVAIGVTLTVALALILAQNLTASMRVGPERVIGISETSGRGLTPAVETQVATAPGLVGYDSGNTPSEQQLAAITDFAQAQGNETIHIPGNAARGYKPPQSHYANAAEDNVIVTIPLSQGRLLRFDQDIESVFIADPAVADIRVVSADLVYVYGKKLGYTNLLAISNQGRGKKNSENGSSGGPRLAGSALLRVVTDPRAVYDAKQQFAPDAPVTIRLFGERLALEGEVKTIDDAVEVANLAQTYSHEDKPPINTMTLEGSNQINIRVRFAEVSRKDLRSFGIDWNVAVSAGSFSFGLQKRSATSTLNPNLAAGASFGNFDIDLLIEALQANGALTVLAEPNLTAVTGETASFLAGGEVPIPVPSGRDKDIISVQYKPFGVSLSFTPTLVKGNRIGLKVKPEVSAISSATSFSVQGFSLPTFTVRRAETAVEVASGQTFALAGLFQREISRTVDKMPLLGDVPVLGALFRSDRYQRNETELVILITPYLVRPVSDPNLATPLDRAPPLSSWETTTIDPSDKGVAFTTSEPESTSGFIMK